MDGNLSQGGMIPGGAPFGGPDLQGSMRVDHQGQHPHTMHHHQHPLHRHGSSTHTSDHDGFPRRPCTTLIKTCPWLITIKEMGGKTRPVMRMSQAIPKKVLMVTMM
ncbi:hypothetical protein OIU78_029433 [Salix suchowensis]|nr:hypothetical protein OIU78_029433 [Salix suchowensis]